MNFKLLLVLITIAASPSTGKGQLVGSLIDAGATSLAKNENGTVQINMDEEKYLKVLSKSETKIPSVSSSSSDNRNCAREAFNKLGVKCENVPMENIKEFFQKTDLVSNNLFSSIKLFLLNGDELIPENVLGNKKTEDLEIYYDDEGSFTLLKVDVNAFQSTKYQTKTLKLKNFDSSQLDLGFLSGFSQLTKLEFFKVHHIQKSLPTLPLLPKLTSLKINYVTGLNDSIITFPTLSTSGLKEFTLFSRSEMHTDASVSRILDWILVSSAKTLKVLIIDSTGIAEIPSQISSFIAITTLFLNFNLISTIRSGTLKFSAPVLYLTLRSNEINSIQPGAFQGNFRDTNVDLSSNPLTRFEESVFRPVLEQMVSGTGRINIEYNPIDCSSQHLCHLAWLICDRKMREKVAYGRCSNGTFLDDLSENGFNHCPVTKNKP